MWTVARGALVWWVCGVGLAFRSAFGARAVVLVVVLVLVDVVCGECGVRLVVCGAGGLRVWGVAEVGVFVAGVLRVVDDTHGLLVVDVVVQVVLLLLVDAVNCVCGACSVVCGVGGLCVWCVVQIGVFVVGVVRVVDRVCGVLDVGVAKVAIFVVAFLVMVAWAPCGSGVVVFVSLLFCISPSALVSMS